MNKIVGNMATKVWLRSRSTKLQAPNPKQYPNSNDQNAFVSEIGHWMIGHYLEFACLPVGRGFGYWDFLAKAGFGSGCAALGGDNHEDFEHAAHGTMHWLSLLFPGLRPSGAQAAFLG
jgi:hypothetical protein